MMQSFSVFDTGPSAVLPLSAGRWRAFRWDTDCLLDLPWSRANRPTREASWFLVQPADAAAWREDLCGLPGPLVQLAHPTCGLALTFPLHRPGLVIEFRLNLAGFSALLVLARTALKLWLVEPDWSVPPPHLGFAYPHLLALCGDPR